MFEELRGRGWRVFGYFLWMLGAGLVLDGDPSVLGVLLLLAGAASFLAGLAQGQSVPVESRK
jgi:hypothetical protein